MQNCSLHLTREVAREAWRRERLFKTNDTSLRDTIFYCVKRYFCRRKNDISQGETIFAKGEMHDVQMQNAKFKMQNCSLHLTREVAREAWRRERLFKTNDTSLRDTIFYCVKRYFCRRKNDISQGETIFAKGEMHHVQMQNSKCKIQN